MPTPARTRLPRTIAAAVVATATLVGALAAGSEKAPPPRTAADTAPVLRPPTPSDSACPRDGTWKACHLEDRINKAGMGISVLVVGS